jgi:hypothetical protein
VVLALLWCGHVPTVLRWRLQAAQWCAQTTGVHASSVLAGMDVVFGAILFAVMVPTCITLQRAIVRTGKELLYVTAHVLLLLPMCAVAHWMWTEHASELRALYNHLLDGVLDGVRASIKAAAQA